MKYACLVMDHDDTVVKSTAQIHYPAFLHTLATLRPETEISLTRFTEICAQPGFVPFCQQELGFTKQEMDFELADWLTFVKEKIPDAHRGMRELLTRFKAAGGLICVVSQSEATLIQRDYLHHFGFSPDMIFDLSYSPQKPDPAPLLEIMEKTGLSSHQLLVVDDLPVGKQMADAAGVDFVYAGWSGTARKIDRAMRKECVYVANTAQELQQLIK